MAAVSEVIVEPTSHDVAGCPVLAIGRSHARGSLGARSRDLPCSGHMLGLACSVVAAVAEGSGPLPNSGGTEDPTTSLVRARCGQPWPGAYRKGQPCCGEHGTLQSGVSKAFRAGAKMRFDLIMGFQQIEIGNGEKEREYTHRSSSVRGRRKSRSRACRG